MTARSRVARWMRRLAVRVERRAVSPEGYARSGETFGFESVTYVSDPYCFPSWRPPETSGSGGGYPCRPVAFVGSGVPPIVAAGFFAELGARWAPPAPPLWTVNRDPCPVCSVWPSGCSTQVVRAEYKGGAAVVERIDPSVARTFLNPCGHEVTMVDVGLSPSYPQDPR